MRTTSNGFITYEKDDPAVGWNGSTYIPPAITSSTKPSAGPQGRRAAGFIAKLRAESAALKLPGKKASSTAANTAGNVSWNFNDGGTAEQPKTTECGTA